MRPGLAAGVTFDFVDATPRSAKFGAMMVSPVFFIACLLTRVPRHRESKPGRDRFLPERGTYSTH